MPEHQTPDEAKRARRIRERNRKYVRAWKHYCVSYQKPEPHRQGGPTDWQAIFRMRSEHARLACDTAHPCSSHCCGNPRRWSGDASMAEWRAAWSAYAGCSEEGLASVRPRCRRSAKG